MKPQNNISVLEIAVRIVADLAVVQTSMLVALVFIAMQTGDSPSHFVQIRLPAIRHYYLAWFLPASLLFPCVYALCGLYRRTQDSNLHRTIWRATLASSGCALATVAASLVLLRAETLMPFCVVFSILMVVGAPGIRYMKHWAFQSERERNGEHRDMVLVVGGAGDIGSLVTEKLLVGGYRVRVLDSLIYGDAPIRHLLSHPALDFIQGDCRDISDVVRAMVGVQSVVHLAAIVGDPACECDRKTAREINYAATRMMIEVAKGEHVTRFVFASSCSVYGQSDEIMTESSEPMPLSLYAETKVDSEKALLGAATETFQPTILRFSTIFGLSRRPRFDLVVNLLTAKAIKEGVGVIYNGDQWRPFLHVDDAAESILRVLEAPQEVVGAQIYNVGDDRLNYTLRQVADEILKALPHARIEFTESPDRRNYRVSFQKIHGALQFTCSKTLGEGIRELKAAFEQGVLDDYKLPLYSNVRFLQEHGIPTQRDGAGAQIMTALAN